MFEFHGSNIWLRLERTDQLVHAAMGRRISLADRTALYVSDTVHGLHHAPATGEMHLPFYTWAMALHIFALQGGLGRIQAVRGRCASHSQQVFPGSML